LVACFLFVNASAADNKYVRAIGEGSNIEQAKENAFRNAVQQRAGVVVLSERQSNLGKLVKDDMSVFSAGYVDDFKIVDINQIGSSIVITLDVLVSDSRLFNQTLNTGKTSKEIDGARAGAAVSSFIEKKQKGDRMLDMVLNTYPQTAYRIEQKPLSIFVDGYRNTILQVPYVIRWNKDYINALNEAMLLLEDKVDYWQQANAKIIVPGKGEHKFNDLITYNKVVDSLKGEREARFLMEIYDNSGSVLWHACYVMPWYFYAQFRQLTFETGKPDSSYLQATFNSQNRYIIDQASRIEVSAVPDSKCH